MPNPSTAPRDANNAVLPTVAQSVVTGTKANSSTTVPVKIVATSTPCRRVVIGAYISNSDAIAIGDSNSVAEPLSGGTKTGQGEQIIQGGFTSIDVADASLLYLAVAHANDGISYSIYV